LVEEVHNLQESLIRTKLAWAEAEHQKEINYMEAREVRKQLAEALEVRGGVLCLCSVSL